LSFSCDEETAIVIIPKVLQSYIKLVPTPEAAAQIIAVIPSFLSTYRIKWSN